jgi:hypothetical protein
VFLAIAETKFLAILQNYARGSRHSLGLSRFLRAPDLKIPQKNAALTPAFTTRAAATAKFYGCIDNLANRGQRAQLQSNA